MSIILGIDVGATGIKGNLVDTKKGVIIDERYKVPTPENSTPKNVLKSMKEIIHHFEWYKKDIGVGFPSIIRNGRCLSASNIDKSWMDFKITKFLNKELTNKVTVVNDADAAGVAELFFGAAKGQKGTVILLTLGTGIGSAIFTHGELLPNSELGHLKWKNGIAEKYASNKARVTKELSFEEWGGELKKVMKHIEHLFSPNLFILGGGISKKFEKFSDYLKGIRADIVPAKMLNDAGIIGAAMAYNIINKKSN